MSGEWKWDLPARGMLQMVADLMAQGSDRDLLEMARELERAISMLREELELRRESREAGK